MVKTIAIPQTDADWEGIFETLDSFSVFFRRSFTHETEHAILDSFEQWRMLDKYVRLLAMVKAYSIFLMRANAEGDKATFDIVLADNATIAHFASLLCARLRGKSAAAEISNEAMLVVVETMGLVNSADSADHQLDLLQQRCLLIYPFIPTRVLSAIAARISEIACTDLTNEPLMYRGLSLLGQIPKSASELSLQVIQSALTEAGNTTYAETLTKALQDAENQQQKLDNTVYLDFPSGPPEDWDPVRP